MLVQSLRLTEGGALQVDADKGFMTAVSSQSKQAKLFTQHETTEENETERERERERERLTAVAHAGPVPEAHRGKACRWMRTRAS